MQYHNRCYLFVNRRHPWWPCKSSHLLVSFNFSSLVNHNLPLGSARFALWRLPSNSRLAMALRSNHWRAHSKQQFVSRQAGCWMASRIWAIILEKLAPRSFCTSIFKMLLWEVFYTRWHITAWMRFNRSLQHKMSSPVNCVFANAPRNSQWWNLSKGNLIVLWFALFCFHLFWWQYWQVFKRQCPSLCVLCFVAHFAPGPGRRVAPQPDHHKARAERPKYLWWAAEGSGGVGRGRLSLAGDLGVWQSKKADMQNCQLTLQVVQHSCSEIPRLRCSLLGHVCRPSPMRSLSTRPSKKSPCSETRSATRAWRLKHRSRATAAGTLEQGEPSFLHTQRHRFIMSWVWDFCVVHFLWIRRADPSTHSAARPWPRPWK